MASGGKSPLRAQPTAKAAPKTHLGSNDHGDEHKTSRRCINMRGPREWLVTAGNVRYETACSPLRGAMSTCVDFAGNPSGNCNLERHATSPSTGGGTPGPLILRVPAATRKPHCGRGVKEPVEVRYRHTH
ncbi:hypothetical protein LshimejAT787_0501240 [Lyophyllum shimeji]|uniref:Uncharacterized protein n=1 Tax=Lyophyllum shimeji TaxID=47721 RepID=A0A9P3UKL7_LYOSH|nr:hypothetical protein LshimejAT787_0501240 [Lyophyllum shimeji]